MSNNHNPLEIPFHKNKPVYNFALNERQSWKKERLLSRIMS